MKRNIFMFTLGFLLLTFFMYCYKTDFNLYKIATDSGFDTSYGGGSSGGSSWGGSSSSSSSYGDSSGGVELDSSSLSTNLVMSIFLVIYMVYISTFFKKRKKLWFIVASLLIVLCIILRIAVYAAAIGFILMLITVIIHGIIIDIRPTKQQIELKKRKYLPKTEENIKLLEEAYEIFIETQIAWMNFDYDKLREVTTDNLYNTYYNQLQSLKIKEQINVMHDFELIRYELVEKVNNDGVNTIKVELEVEFYDYISNDKGVCIRGNNFEKVHMLYDLTYVYSEKAIEECPNCNAPISSSDSICSHCRANIPSVRGKMKLSTKQCLKQK